MKKRKKAVRLPYLVLVPFAASVCLVIWMIFSGALMSTDEATQSLGGIFDGTSAVHWPLIPNSPTLQPLIEVLLDTPEFFVMFWNTCILTFPQLIGQFLLASPAAWAFSRFTFRGRNLLFTIYTILMLLPFQVLMVPDYLVLDRLGLMDTVWSIILPGAVSTFPVFIMKKGFDGIPVSVLEAAELDGAGAITTYIRIGLPLGIPGILSALLLSFIEAWNATAICAGKSDGMVYRPCITQSQLDRCGAVHRRRHNRYPNEETSIIYADDRARKGTPL